MLVPIIALFAAIAFNQKARQKGCRLLKPTLFPLVTGLVVTLAFLVLFFSVEAVLRGAGSSEKVIGFFGWVSNLFFVLVYGVLISRAWRSLRDLPDRPPKNADLPSAGSGSSGK